MARAGSRTLEMLASSINSDILRALSGGPKDLRELGRDLGSPIQLPGREPDMVARLTPSGREMLFVTASLERWLTRSPRGPLPFGGDGATEAIEALAKSWSSTVTHALAERPRSLEELDRLVDVAGYPSTERCLEAMLLAGQVEARPSRGPRALYEATDWLREGIGPLAAAARLERRHHPADAPPVAALDVEAAFLLTLPLVRLPDALSGSCRFEVKLAANAGGGRAGVLAQVKKGRIGPCSRRLDSHAGSSVSGDLSAWFQAVIDRDFKRLRPRGDEILAGALLDGLYRALFGDRRNG